MSTDVYFTPEEVKRLFAKHSGKIAIQAGIISFIAGFVFAYMTFAKIHIEKVMGFSEPLGQLTLFDF
ncbi:MAG: hypothetical protein QUS12_10860 [Methanosarcina sp.]|nr:hypothetical protein [Methanosarcina sp.]